MPRGPLVDQYMSPNNAWEAAVVDVLEAPAFLPDVATEEPATAPAPLGRERGWTRYLPWLLVLFAVAFSAWLLRAELRVLPYTNDSTGHSALARFAAERIRTGHNPFDAWFPYFGLGSPQYTQYQSLAHILTGFLSLVFGGWIFRGTNYFLMCTWPITVYAGARLLGLDRRQAGASALLSPMLVNITAYGIEWKSFVWMGFGMWSMLWAIWLLPITLGLAWRAVAKGERIALAAFVVGLTCALHFMTGYLVLLAFGVFVLLRPPEFVMRLGRSAVVGLGGLVIFAFVFVPALAGIQYVNVDALQTRPYWKDSYGPGRVLSWLFHGQIFDYGHFPVVSLLVLLGTIASLRKVRRSEAARVPLGLMILSLLLYSGRSVVGPVVNYLPGGQDLFLHRYVMGVHLAGLLLAGIGAVWAVELIAAATRFLRLRHHKPVAIALAAIVTLVAMYPLVANRKDYADADRGFINRQVATGRGDGRDVAELIDFAKQRNDGRIYAGGSNSWGLYRRLNEIPLYLLPLQQATDSVGYYFPSDSLSANIEPLFNDGKLQEYDLFNVKYVLVATRQRPSIADVTLLAQRGKYSLYEVDTSGYLQVVDATQPVPANRGDMASVMGRYISSRAVAEFRHPLIAFNGNATPEPSMDRSAPYTGAPGSVEHTTVDLPNAHFTGRVTASRPAWVMLKESYAPHWTATVDGKPVKPQMLAPSFVGIPVPAGTHEVAFQYRPSRSYPALFGLGALTLLGLALGPVARRRFRRGTTVPK